MFSKKEYELAAGRGQRGLKCLQHLQSIPEDLRRSLVVSVSQCVRSAEFVLPD